MPGNLGDYNSLTQLPGLASDVPNPCRPVWQSRSRLPAVTVPRHAVVSLLRQHGTASLLSEVSAQGPALLAPLLSCRLGWWSHQHLLLPHPGLLQFGLEK